MLMLIELANIGWKISEGGRHISHTLEGDSAGADAGSYNDTRCKGCEELVSALVT